MEKLKPKLFMLVLFYLLLLYSFSLLFFTLPDTLSDFF